MAARRKSARSRQFPSYGMQTEAACRPQAARDASANLEDYGNYGEIDVVLELQKRLGDAICAVLKEKYGLADVNVPLETPPDLRMGEAATPVAFELARKLRKAPKAIAQEIVAALESRGVEGFAGFEVAGAGYINARLDRGLAVQMVIRGEGRSPSTQDPSTQQEHALVEHTSINPNKAAHIGHL